MDADVPERVSTRRSFSAGVVAIAPVILGIIPFGLVAGVAAVEAGLGLPEAIGFSTVVFAGASQLAALDLVGAGAPVGVAVMTAVVINLRMAMYSAALAPWLADRPPSRRALASYLLTDQAFAVSVARFAESGRQRVDPLAFYLGTAVALWVTWQITTVLGVQVGAAVPDTVPLGFAVPLAFLALLVPSITDRPSLAAALVGGTVAVVGAPLPANLGMPLGAVSGVAVGYLLVRWQRQAAA